MEALHRQIMLNAYVVAQSQLLQLAKQMEFDVDLSPWEEEVHERMTDFWEQSRDSVQQFRDRVRYVFASHRSAASADADMTQWTADVIKSPRKRAVGPTLDAAASPSRRPLVPRAVPQATWTPHRAASAQLSLKSHSSPAPSPGPSPRIGAPAQADSPPPQPAPAAAAPAPEAPAAPPSAERAVPDKTSPWPAVTPGAGVRAKRTLGSAALRSTKKPEPKDTAAARATRAPAARFRSSFLNKSLRTAMEARQRTVSADTDVDDSFHEPSPFADPAPPAAAAAAAAAADEEAEPDARAPLTSAAGGPSLDALRSRLENVRRASTTPTTHAQPIQPAQPAQPALSERRASALARSVQALALDRAHRVPTPPRAVAASATPPRPQTPTPEPDTLPTTIPARDAEPRAVDERGTSTAPRPAAHTPPRPEATPSRLARPASRFGSPARPVSRLERAPTERHATPSAAAAAAERASSRNVPPMSPWRTQTREPGARAPTSSLKPLSLASPSRLPVATGTPARAATPSAKHRDDATPAPSARDTQAPPRSKPLDAGRAAEARRPGALPRGPRELVSPARRDGPSVTATAASPERSVSRLALATTTATRAKTPDIHGNAAQPTPPRAATVLGQHGTTPPRARDAASPFRATATTSSRSRLPVSPMRPAAAKDAERRVDAARDGTRTPAAVGRPASVAGARAPPHGFGARIKGLLGLGASAPAPSAADVRPATALADADLRRDPAAAADARPATALDQAPAVAAASAVMEGAGDTSMLSASWDDDLKALMPGSFDEAASTAVPAAKAAVVPSWLRAPPAPASAAAPDRRTSSTMAPTPIKLKAMSKPPPGPGRPPSRVGDATAAAPPRRASATPRVPTAPLGRGPPPRDASTALRTSVRSASAAAPAKAAYVYDAEGKRRKLSQHAEPTTDDRVATEDALRSKLTAQGARSASATVKSVRVSAAPKPGTRVASAQAAPKKHAPSATMSQHNVFQQAPAVSDTPAPDDELPEVASEYSDSEDEASIKKRKLEPSWTRGRELEELLLQQATLDPDEIFGCQFEPVPLDSMLPPRQGDRRRQRHRTSSANWSGPDGLAQWEIDRYNERMGIRTRRA